MESTELIYIYLLFTLVLICLLCYHQIGKRWHFERIGIPCASTWPVLGSLPTAMRHGILLHDILTIKQYGKVHGTYLGNHPNLVVADPRYIKEIFIKQFNKFPHRMQALYISDWWSNSVVMASGDHWRYMRSVIVPAFSSVKLRQMQPQLTQTLHTLSTCLANQIASSARGTIDMRKVLSALTMDIICNTSFGHKMNTLQDLDNEFSRHAKIVSTLSIESNPLNGLPLILPCIKRLFRLLDLDYVNKTSLNYIKDFIHEMIFTRRSVGESQDVQIKDILQNLMNAHTEDAHTDENGNICENSYKFFKQRGLTDDELIANALVVLMAGYDTTATTLTWMCYLLATNQDVQKKLVDAIDNSVGSGEPTYENVMSIEYLDWFLSETLRLYPAANRTGRDAIVETDVCGTLIQEGTSVTIPIYAIHRMPEYWSEPERCVPERFAPENKCKIIPYTYLPFGAGPRICLGIRMAQMLCKIVTVKLLQNFTLGVSEFTEKTPVLETSLLTKPKNGMFLSLSKRNSTKSS